MPPTKLFAPLPTCRPLQGEPHKYYTLYGSFLQAACGMIAERTDNRKMGIIEDLYNGKVCPTEDIIPQDIQYRPLANDIGNERKYFASRLSAEDQERFEKWNSLVFRYEEMVEYANFEYGFRLGALLTLETFCGERGQTENEEDQQSETDTESLLNLLADKRMETKIDIVVESDRYYQSTLEEQDKAFSQMDSLIGALGLDKQQRAVFNQAISANNAVGAAYGEAAYRFGLCDGIRLSAEIKKTR